MSEYWTKLLDDRDFAKIEQMINDAKISASNIETVGLPITVPFDCTDIRVEVKCVVLRYIGSTNTRVYDLQINAVTKATETMYFDGNRTGGSGHGYYSAPTGYVLFKLKGYFRAGDKITVNCTNTGGLNQPRLETFTAFMNK